MAIPQNKAQLIEAIRTTYHKLQLDIERVPHDMAMQKSMPGHAKDTLMNPYQLIAYLVGWADLVIDWNAKFSTNQIVVFPTEGYSWNQLGVLAQKFYTDYPDYDFVAIKALLQEKVNHILNIVESKSNDELYTTIWYKKYTAGRMIQLNTSSPYKNARTRVRKFLRDNVKT